MSRTMLALCASLLAAAPALAGETARVPVSDRAQPCPSQGAGFVHVPGSDTCIRLAGRVRAGLDARSAPTVAAAPAAEGHFAIDTRSETAYGPIRTFVRAGNGRP